LTLGALPRGAKLGTHLGMEDLLPALIEFGDAAAFGKSPGKLGRGLRRRHALGQEIRHLARRDCAEISASHYRCESQRFYCGAHLRLPKALARDFGARLQGHECENLGDDAALDIKLDRSRQYAERKGRAWRKTRFDHDGFRNAKLIIGRLQAAIVEERNL